MGRDVRVLGRRTEVYDYIVVGAGSAACAVAGRLCECAQLRVLGVSKLRIADTSVMPTLVTGNRNASAIMIGERAADFVR